VSTASGRIVHRWLSLFGRRFTGTGAAGGPDGRSRRTGPQEKAASAANPLRQSAICIRAAGQPAV